MKRFKVTAITRTMLTVEIEAENEDAALQIAKDTDGGDFEESHGEGSWDIESAVELPPLLRYEIRFHTFCDGWKNTFTMCDEYGNESLITYATAGEAQEALDKVFEDQAKEIDCGNMEAVHGYSRDEYCIYDRVVEKAVS